MYPDDPSGAAGPTGAAQGLSAALARRLTVDGCVGAPPEGVPDGVVAALAADLAEGRDPWAIAAGGAHPVRPRRPVAARLAALFAAMRLWPEPGSAAAVTAPAALTVIRCRDREMAVALERVLARHVLPAAGGEPEAGDEDDRSLDDLLAEIDDASLEAEGSADAAPSRAGPDIAVVHAPGSADTRDAGAGPRFARAIADGLRDDAAVVVLATAMTRLPDETQPLTGADLALPDLDADTVLEMLRLTHSATGEVAEGAIRAVLPGPEALASVTPLQIDTAIREPTTLAVAHRLAAIAAKAQPRAGRTLADLHGLGAAKPALEGLARDLESWRSGTLDWRGVGASLLLHGPPGCGKTMAAEALAGSARAAFVATSYAELQSAGHMGDLLARLEDRVAEAVRRAPSVFFLDELDSFGHRHGTGRNARYMTSVVNGLLETLGRLADAEGVAVIGATNHPGAIDPALLRSGRFDRRIAVPLPDRAGLEAILAAHLGGALPRAALARVARSLAGDSGADAAAVARQAQGRARDAGRAVTAQDLHKAARSIRPEPDRDLLRRIAVHEAGHLIVGHVVGTPTPRAVRITPTGGHVEAPDPATHTHATATAGIARLMAGRAAERFACSAPTSGAGEGHASDLAQATDLALRMELQWGMGDAGPTWRPLTSPPTIPLDPPWLRAKIKGVLEEAEHHATRILRGHRAALHAIAGKLLSEREITGQRLERLLEQHVSQAEHPPENIVVFNPPW